MRVESSQLALAATHQAESKTVVLDEILVRSRPSTGPRLRAIAMDTVEVSAPGWVSAELNRDDLQEMDPKQRLAALAIEALLGHRIRWRRSQPGTTGSSSAPAVEQVRRRTEYHAESERTSFRAEGSVELATGETVRFAVSFDLQREFRSLSTSISAGNATDPLVVNFGGTPGALAEGKISFDLDAGGTLEQISLPGRGSGFLVLDANGDGKVNDGRELFGPQTGNGFAELAAYDADGNGWIDEGDPVYARLRLWSVDGLSTLAERAVGAISTASVETPFEIKDSANTLQAVIRRSGVYLSELGGAGIVQQFDLATS